MPTVVACPSCSRQLRLPDELAGKSVRCPGCGETFEGEPEPSPLPEVEVIAPVPPAPADDRQPCPYCREPIKADALACPYCQQRLDGDGDVQPWETYGIRRDIEPHRGTLILVLGILSLALMVFYIFPVTLPLGLTAWILGHLDRARMDRREMDPTGHGTTTAGYVCGIIGTLGSALMLTCCVGWIVMVAAA